MNTVMILAGGIGARMGADIPKQFIKILDKPIIAYTLEIFENYEDIDAIEIVCVHGYEKYLKEIIKEYNFEKVRWICEGGSTFSLSVYQGLKNLKNVLSSNDIVIIHMGVAPFIGNDLIDDAIRVAKEKGNSILAIYVWVLETQKNIVQRAFCGKQLQVLILLKRSILVKFWDYMIERKRKVYLIL